MPERSHPVKGEDYAPVSRCPPTSRAGVTSVALTKAVQIGICGILLALLFRGSAPAADSAGPPESVIPASVWSVPLYPMRSPRPAVGHIFTFWRYDEICDPGRRLVSVQLVERPRTAARPFKSAVITVTLEDPERTAPKSCPPGQARALMHIRTKRPAASLIFFDGSSDPPRRLWPPAQRVH